MTASPLDYALRQVFMDVLKAGNGKVLPSEADRQIGGSLGLRSGDVMAAVYRCHVAGRAALQTERGTEG